MEVIEQIQTVLGDRYTIEREIGRGGMATVYLAEEHRPLRRVAIKVLDPALANGVGRERFLREVEFSSQLTHPNIVPIFGADEIGDLLYYVMPFIGGDTLRTRLAKQGSLPLEDALAIATEVGDALHYAHTQGVVHRDIKPENILLAGSHALVADFGIARALCAACGDGDQITIAGVPIGTPGYMAPEQIRGEEVDPRADVYSLGCVVFEMLTGRPPFPGPTVDAILAARYSQPTPTLHGSGWNTSATIDQAVRRAMEVDREKRLESAADFLEMLKARAAQAKLGLSVTTDEFSTTFDSAVSATAPDKKAVAVLPFANLSADPENEYFSDGITDDIITQLSKIPGVEVTSRTSVMQYKGTTKSLGQIGDELRVTSVLEGSVRRAGNRVRVVAQLIDSRTDKHLWAERFDRELTDIFEIQSEIAEQIAAALEAKLSPEDMANLKKKPTDNMEAYNRYLRGKFYWEKFTVAGVERSIELFQEAVALDADYALAHAGLAGSYVVLSVTLGKLAPDVGLPKAKAAALKALEQDDTLADAYATLGLVCMWYDYDWPAADKATARALELDPEGDKPRSMRGMYLAAVGRHDEAIALAQETARLFPTAMLPATQPGLHYYWARRFEEAAAALEAAAELDPNFPPTRYLLGWTYLHLDRFDEAIAEAARACELTGDTPQRRAAMGCALAKAGRTSEAQAILDEIETRCKTEYVSYADLAMLHGYLGNVDEAYEWLAKAVDQRAGWLGYLRSDAIWDPISDDPRFAAIVEQVGP